MDSKKILIRLHAETKDGSSESNSDLEKAVEKLIQKTLPDQIEKVTGISVETSVVSIRSGPLTALFLLSAGTATVGTVRDLYKNLDRIIALVEEVGTKELRPNGVSRVSARDYPTRLPEAHAPYLGQWPLVTALLIALVIGAFLWFTGSMINRVDGITRDMTSRVDELRGQLFKVQVDFARLDAKVSKHAEGQGGDGTGNPMDPILPPPLGKTPEPPGGGGVIEGTGKFSAFGWIFVAIGLIALAVGLLAFFKGDTVKGGALATIGTVVSLGGATLLKEVKIDIGDLTLLKLIREEVHASGAIGPELLGVIQRFKLGSPDEVEERDIHKDVQRIAACWVERRKSGREGVLLIVGATDRTPLNYTSQRRFEANVGLAQARAESVKEMLAAEINRNASGLGPQSFQVLALVSGPRYTPPLTAARALGAPNDDRHVDVWAFWSQRKDAPTTRPLSANSDSPCSLQASTSR